MGTIVTGDASFYDMGASCSMKLWAISWCAVPFFLLTFVAAVQWGASAFPSPTPCPTPFAKLVDNPSLRFRSFEVLALNRTSGRIRGIDRTTHREATVPVCNSTQINEGAAGLPYIRPGDQILAYELSDRHGRYLATKLTVNSFTSNVLIKRISSQSVDFVQLDYHTNKPVVKNPDYLGAVASRGVFDAKTRVFDGTRKVVPSRGNVGRYAKIYGFKRPSSKSVVIYLLELWPKNLM